MSTLVPAAESSFTLPRDLILASAGSGKTFRISSDIIALLAQGEAPDEIFASTFTRKAAGEILDRVLVRLAQAALSEDAALDLAEHARLVPVHRDLFAGREFDCAFWTAVLERTVRRLHRMSIGTLDAFFLRTATSFAHELGLPARWGIADEPTADRLRSLALQDVLRRTDAAVLLPLIRGMVRNPATRSLHDQLLRKLRTLMAVHYALDPFRDDHWNAFDALAEGTDGDALAAERTRLAAELARAEVPVTKQGKPRTHWVNALAEIDEALRTGNWGRFLACTLVQRAREGLEFDRAPVPPGIGAVLDAAWQVAKAETARRMSASSHALERFAQLYAAALERRRAELGAFEFDDITRVLGGPDPLGGREDMYYRLDARAKHILLDEFQDTSVPQWHALRPLAEELLSGHEDERAAVIVADPKQSIYGWRGGTPDLVRHLQSAYAMQRGVLAKSWRSSRVVLDFVNELYRGLAEDAAWEDERFAEVARDWLREFQPHAPAKDLPGHVVVRIGPEDEGSGESRPRLCRYAAAQVKALHEALPGRSIGVLTRTNATVARLMLNLKDLGVHASEEGGNPLTDAASVTSVLALLRLCDNPGNTVARYQVASTPVGAALGYRDHTDEPATLALAAAWRRRLLEDGYGATITALAAQVGDACDVRERRRLAQLVELAFRFEDGATLRPSDFVHFVRRERVEDPVAADVRVMTVHQAKGLEFDIVVLPELDAPLVQSRPPEVLAYRPTPGAPVTRAFPQLNRALRALFPELRELVAADEQAFRNELRDGLSTLYVGLTRARHALHIIAKPNQGNSRTGARVLLRALAPGRTDFAEDDIVLERGDAAWHAALQSAAAPGGASPQDGPVTPTGSRHPDDDSGARGDPPRDGALPAAKIALRPSATRSRALPRRSPSQLEGNGRVDLGMVLRLSAAAGRGSVVHRWFEAIGWLEDGVPADAQLAALAAEVDAGLEPGHIETLRTEFRAWLGHPAIAQLLSRKRWPAGSTVACEVPFLAREGDTMMEGFIDRLVLTRTAGRVTAAAVIDFKTDAVTKRAEVAQRTSHYAPQLEAYRRAVCGMYGLAPADVQAWLVFVEAGAVERVDVNPRIVPSATAPVSVVDGG